MLKKIIIAMLSIAMILSLGACGVKEKINDKIAEKVTEGVMEKVAGDGTEVDIEDGQLSITGEDGEEFTLGGSEWPEGEAIDLIPEFKKGSITSIMNTGTACVVILEEVEEKDFNEYVEVMIDKGFTSEFTQNSDNGIGYFGKLNEDAEVSLVYASDNKVLNIAVEVIE